MTTTSLAIFILIVLSVVSYVCNYVRFENTKKTALSEIYPPLSAGEAYRLCVVLAAYRDHYDGNKRTFYISAGAKLFVAINDAIYKATTPEELNILSDYAYAHCDDEDVHMRISQTRRKLRENPVT